MSTKKYILKKDIRTIVLKLPPILSAATALNTPSGRSKLTIAKSSLIHSHKKVFSGLASSHSPKKHKNTKNRTRSLTKDHKKQTFLPLSVINHTNNRYMEDISEEVEVKNVIETPIDSKSITRELEPLNDTISSEYERYLLSSFTPVQPKAYKQGLLEPSQKITLNISASEFSDTPPDILKFWKTRRIF